MSWTLKAAREIRFSFNCSMSIWVSKKDLEAHPEVERIRHMDISNEEKLRLFKEKEQDILRDIVGQKFSAISRYSEESQSSKMDVDGFGDPDGSVDWQDVLGLWERREEEVT